MYTETAKKLLKATKANFAHFEHDKLLVTQTTKTKQHIHWKCLSGISVPECLHVVSGNFDRIHADIETDILWTTPGNDPMWRLEGQEAYAMHDCMRMWEGVLECAPYASVDQPRIALNGVCISGRGQKCLVATDGRRLRLVDGDFGQQAVDQDFLIIPNDVIKIAKSLGKGMCSLQVFEKVTQHADGIKDGVQQFFESTTVFIAASWYAKDGGMLWAWWNATDLGPFPNFNQIIPRYHEMEIAINGQELEAALKKCELIASKNTHQIEFHPGTMGKFQVRVTNLDLGIDDKLVAEVSAVRISGERSEMKPTGFNLVYLQEILGKKLGRVVMRFLSPVQPTVIEKNNGFCILMPLRITR